MPEFKNYAVTVETEIDIEFEVFCAKCGSGICHSAKTRESRRRGMPQIEIEPCETCQKNLRDELEDEIAVLKMKNDELEEQIHQIQ